jgi:hypothetical protein
MLDADGTRIGPLDSLARVLEPRRTDGVRIAVGLTLDGRASPADDADRVQAIERVLVRLRPDVIFPAMAAPFPGWFAPAPPNAAWWRSMLTRTARDGQFAAGFGEAAGAWACAAVTPSIPASTRSNAEKLL